MKVFLSYAAGDHDVAESLARELAAAGYDVWRWETSVLPGDNWATKTGDALRDSRAMIVLLSPEAVKSPNVRREIEYAIGSPNYEGRVIPVLLRPTQVPWILNKLSPIRAGKSLSQTSKRIIEQLRTTEVAGA